jgi:stage V sporulation protein R
MGVKIFEELDRKYGRDFIFEVRELNSDVSFIRNYLSKEIVEEMNLYTFGKKSNAYYVTSTDVEQIRDVLITQRSNGGSPCIVVRDGDYMKNRELYLVHKYDGVELDIKYAEHTLKNVHFLWNRAVHLETVIEDKKMLISFDGKQIQRKYI